MIDIAELMQRLKWSGENGRELMLSSEESKALIIHLGMLSNSEWELAGDLTGTMMKLRNSVAEHLLATELNKTTIEMQRQRIDELEDSVIAPGIMRCAKCSFVLTKNSINMSAGTITAGDSKSEPCPNGCGPLWPVTWKEQAIEMRDSSEQWFEDLQESKKRVAELESHTITVILPDRRSIKFWPGDASEFDIVGYQIAVEDQLTAAGIKVYR